MDTTYIDNCYNSINKGVKNIRNIIKEMRDGCYEFNNTKVNNSIKKFDDCFEEKSGKLLKLHFEEMKKRRLDKQKIEENRKRLRDQEIKKIEEQSEIERKKKLDKERERRRKLEQDFMKREAEIKKIQDELRSAELQRIDEEQQNLLKQEQDRLKKKQQDDLALLKKLKDEDQRKKDEQDQLVDPEEDGYISYFQKLDKTIEKGFEREFNLSTFNDETNNKIKYLNNSINNIENLCTKPKELNEIEIEKEISEIFLFEMDYLLDALKLLNKLLSPTNCQKYLPLLLQSLNNHKIVITENFNDFGYKWVIQDNILKKIYNKPIIEEKVELVPTDQKLEERLANLNLPEPDYECLVDENCIKDNKDCDPQNVLCVSKRSSGDIKNICLEPEVKEII